MQGETGLEPTDVQQALESVDIFKEAKIDENLVGNTFYLDYSYANILVPDVQKQKVGGLPQGSLLVAFYNSDQSVDEALLLRVLEPTALPTNSEAINSTGLASGLKCRILGSFYRGADGKTQFGADVENSFGAHGYRVYKPQDRVLEYVVNYRDGSVVHGDASAVRIGAVRYSSSQRIAPQSVAAVCVTPTDLLGKRSGLFGGTSNTVKQLVRATVQMSDKAKLALKDATADTAAFDDERNPSLPIGQIIFDVNGRYANEHLQDTGTALSVVYKERTVRYSILKKNGFKKLVNSTKDLTATEVNPVFQEIVDELRKGKIVIVDLSQGSPDVQQYLCGRICRSVLNDALERFMGNKPTNFVQVYFEDALALYPNGKKKDLKNIYNRLVNEGEKLSLGLLYVTQEASTINSSLLKSTQNWVITHLNNEDEICELRKYYDFADFADSLSKYSAGSDEGFVRIKMHSNAFTVPVQIDTFAAAE